MGSAPTTTVAVPSVGPDEVPVTLRVNGQTHTVFVDPRTTLLDALRERLALTGTKKGCDRGACGACTVLVDGQRINSCLTLAIMHEGQAGILPATIDVHRAGAALPVVATLLGPGEVKGLPQAIQQGGARIDPERAALAIDAQGHGDPVFVPPNRLRGRTPLYLP